jgi:DNA polymerase-3 subunit delta
MAEEKILSDWKKKVFKPIYWLEGEEDYYIDQIINYAEHSILNESETSFNLSIFYGKDAIWTSVINACRRYPMFAEKQVIILKEAQLMNDIDLLEPYFESPLSSTIFVIAYKGKTYDKRTKLYKTIQKNGEIFQSKKLHDSKIPDWIAEIAKSKGYTLSSKGLNLLFEHVGNDLSRIVSEIDKLSVNLKGKNTIDENDIEKYIGISKEYNVFELQAAITNKDLSRAIKIINYFEGNNKAGPIQLVLPTLYGYFSKVYAAYGLSDKSENGLKPLFYNNYYAAKEAHTMMRNYGYPGVERLILLLHHYNLKGVGVGDSGTESASLLKEMVVKMMIS